MSEREILFNMGLASGVFASVIFVFLVGGLPAVAVASLCVHYTVRRIEAQRTSEKQAVAVRGQQGGERS